MVPLATVGALSSGGEAVLVFLDADRGVVSAAANSTGCWSLASRPVMAEPVAVETPQRLRNEDFSRERSPG